MTVLAVLLSVSAARANEDLQKAETYLNGLKNMKADFTQTYWDENNNEQVLTGTFYLDRPGRMRFEFNEIEDFIVADGFFVYFYDAEERQQTNAPIGQTLADFILQDDISFTDDITVEDIKKSNGYTYITLTQTADPSAGSLQLMFSQIPYALKKWRVVDALGTAVDVKFENMTEDVDFESGFFMYRDPYAPIGQYND